MYDVVVVGGGPAGITAGIRARELGAKVAIIERGRLGGACTNDGCVPTRVLAKAARLMREAEQFDDYGLNAKLPIVDFNLLMSKVKHTIETIHTKKHLVNNLEKAGVALITGSGDVHFSDEHTLSLPDGSRITGETIIICVGGHARRVKFPGSELAIDHHDVWNLTKLPKSVTIIGGAATGCQLASIFNSLGVRVSILEVGSLILAREDYSVSKVMTDILNQTGINIITQIAGVTRIEKDQDELSIWYQKDGKEELVSSEAAVMAVGWVGNSDELNLQAANIKTDRGYIVVNDYQQTSVDHIFAAGDITGRMMLVQSGSYEGRIAAENAVLGIGQPYQHRVVPHGGFTDPEYGGVGLTEDEAAKDNDCITAVVEYTNLDRAVIDGHPIGFCKLIVSQETHRILGGHVVGEQAVEIVQLIATAIAGNIWIEQLAELELAYPTYTAIVGLAAREIVRKLGVMPLAPQWRAMGPLLSAEWERDNNR